MDEPEKSLPAVRRRRDVTAPIRRRPKRPLPEATGLALPGDDHHDSYDDFLPAALQTVRTPPSSLRRTYGYLLCGLIACALIASLFYQLRLFAIAPGEYQAQGGSQIVEPREAGQLKAIHIKNGDHVKQGDVVLELDPTSAQASRAIIQAKLTDARAEMIRRRVAVKAAVGKPVNKDAPIAWPNGLPSDVRGREESILQADLAQLVATLNDLDAKLKAKEASRDKYVANIAAQKLLIASRSERADMHIKLADMGRDSRARVLEALEPLRQEQVTLATFESALSEAKASIPVIKNEMTKARDAFVAANTDKLAAAERLANDLTQQLIQADLVLANLTLRAPVTGTIQSLAVTNTGQQVKVGQKLLQVVPDGTPLEIQAYVLNTDIGFVREGQPAVIKVDTFPYTRYGTIEGRVTRVGADAITGSAAIQLQKDNASTPSKGPLSVSQPVQATSDLVFPVTVVPSRSTIKVDGRDVPLAAGMSVVVEIETARERAIGYILYPLTRAWRSRPPS